MTANEIIERLKSGSEIEKQTHWFTHVSDKKQSFSLDGENITKKQFEKIHHLLTRVREERNFAYYKLLNND